jgi:hypothetical protein
MKRKASNNGQLAVGLTVFGHGNTLQKVRCSHRGGQKKIDGRMGYRIVIWSK